MPKKAAKKAAKVAKVMREYKGGTLHSGKGGPVVKSRKQAIVVVVVVLVVTGAALVEKLLNEQPDILGINRKYTYDALKDILTKWLNPEDEAATEAPIASKDEEEEEDDFIAEMNKPVVPAYALENNAAKTSNADKFDNLFNE